MRIIVGLGNPGKKFEATRHNAGFLALEYFASTLGVSFREEKKFHAEIAEVTLHKEKILLVKPLTFMNCSGETIDAILRFYKETPEHLLVLHDDLDIPSDTYKITTSSRSAGNNGVQSIIDTLGTQDFTRIRIGIGRPDEVLGVCTPSHDYVLGKLTEPESEAQIKKLPGITENIINWIRQ